MVSLAARVQDCTRGADSSPSCRSSFCPEYAQIDLPGSGSSAVPWMYLPLPVISPADAVLAPAPTTEAAQIATPSNVLLADLFTLNSIAVRSEPIAQSARGRHSPGPLPSQRLRPASGYDGLKIPRPRQPHSGTSGGRLGIT